MRQIFFHAKDQEKGRAYASFIDDGSDILEEIL